MPRRGCRCLRGSGSSLQNLHGGGLGDTEDTRQFKFPSLRRRFVRCVKPQQRVGSLATKVNPKFLLKASARPRFGKGLVDWSADAGAAPSHSGGGRAPRRPGSRRHLPHLKSRSRPWVWLVKRVKASMAPADGQAAHLLGHESSGFARLRGRTGWLSSSPRRPSSGRATSRASGRGRKL